MAGHEGHRQRLTERFLREGLDGFDQHQILELLLFYAIPRRDTNELAHTIIDRFGSLGAAMDAPQEALTEIPGVGDRTAALIRLIPRIARRCELSRYSGAVFLSSRRAAGEYCLRLLSGMNVESFYVISLDSLNRVIYADRLAEGTVTETPVQERKVVELVVKRAAVSIILAHNHPAGGLAPSPADIKVTNKLITLMDMMGVRVLDHLIVGGGRYASVFDAMNL